jgi:hypothetical protein
MSKVIHFELGMEDPDRAVRFYQEVFGWKIETWGGPEPYWLATTGPEGEPGINGGMMRNKQMKALGVTKGAVNSISVDSVDATVERIVRAGGRVIQPKGAIPGIGYQAYCEDTEGNVMGIHQSDPGAK